MSATFIPALVIKHNNDVYLTPDLVVGNTMSIPTPGSGAVIDGDYWAQPITDAIVSGFNFIPTSPDSEDAPTPQSFHVFRLVNRFGNDVWYVVGRTTFDGAAQSPVSTEFGYIQAAQDAECCSDDPRTLPTDTPLLAPCQLMCEYNADNQYFAVFALPTLTGNLRYYPYGYFNGVALPSLTPTGYATAGALVSALNGNGTWNDVGTWVDTGNGIIQVNQTNGSGEDVVCIVVTTVNPSL